MPPPFEGLEISASSSAVSEASSDSNGGKRIDGIISSASCASRGITLFRNIVIFLRYAYALCYVSKIYNAVQLKYCLHSMQCTGI
mmetsp:Transcript_24810/g.38011  ORF Transcript_24810/g.38011 Transcript_24810/m.38011 type:complete len:85 (-) Transcript_24810:464-718(-)